MIHNHQVSEKSRCGGEKTGFGIRHRQKKFSTVVFKLCVLRHFTSKSFDLYCTTCKMENLLESEAELSLSGRVLAYYVKGP